MPRAPLYVKGLCWEILCLLSRSTPSSHPSLQPSALGWGYSTWSLLEGSWIMIGFGPWGVLAGDQRETTVSMGYFFFWLPL